MTSTDDLDVRVAYGVATVTIDRPPVNALDTTICRQISDVFDAFADNRDVNVVMLTAAGDRAFSAGADIKKPRTSTPEDPVVHLDRGEPFRRAFWSVLDCTVPVIAAVNGPAIGAGLAVVASCDVIIAAESATFGLTEIDVGVLGGFTFLERMVGPYKARKMFFTGELASAAEFHRLGAVEKVVPLAKLSRTAAELAELLNRKSPIALRLAKESANRTEWLSLKDGYRTEQDYTQRLARFDDSQEAVQAFIGKRDGEWRWR